MSLISKLKQAADQADHAKAKAEEDALALEASEREKTLLLAKRDAAALYQQVLTAVEEAATKGKRRLDYSLAFSRPAYNSLESMTAEEAVRLLRMDNLSAATYFNHERIDGGCTGDSYDEDEYGISVWGW